MSRRDPTGRRGENSRSGTKTRTVLTEIGPVEIQVPRARDASFSPTIVRKRQCRLDGIDEIALSLTARGLITDVEVAEFWLAVLTEIKNRGTADVCIAVCDGLAGLGEAITAVWPATVVQTCVPHLTRHTFRYASRRDWEAMARELHLVYTAPPSRPPTPDTGSSPSGAEVSLSGGPVPGPDRDGQGPVADVGAVK